MLVIGDEIIENQRSHVLNTSKEKNDSNCSNHLTSPLNSVKGQQNGTILPVANEEFVESQEKQTLSKSVNVNSCGLCLQTSICSSSSAEVNFQPLVSLDSLTQNENDEYPYQKLLCGIVSGIKKGDTFTLRFPVLCKSDNVEVFSLFYFSSFCNLFFYSFRFMELMVFIK